MNIDQSKPVAVIGAGIAGLTAAKCLRQNNIPFILFEGGKKIAGLAASFKDAEGFSHDFGAHFITNRLAKAIGISAECRLVKYYGESVWIKGKTYSYPFGLIRIPRMSLSWMASQFKSLHTGHAPESAADWFTERYGSALANEVALPLIEAWSGIEAKDLSAGVGDGLFGGHILKTLYLKMAAMVTGRAVACGYSKEKAETPKVWHVYPEKGVSAICEKLAEDLKDCIRLESPVNSIFVRNEKVTEISVAGKIIEVSGVISTAPANILSKLVKGTNALKSIEAFRYRPMIFINMRFEGRMLLSDTVLWLPEKKFPFFRLTEAPISMPWLAPEGKTIITVDIGCEKDDHMWSMDEDKLARLCLDHLSEIIPDARERYLGCTVLRTQVAYPVFLNSYETDRRNFANSTQIENLLSVGRNGEFSHMFMEDVYWRTQKKMEEFIKKRKLLSESGISFA